MKKKELALLRSKELSELAKTVSEKKLSLDKFGLDSKDVSNKNLKKGWILRREVAQILTLIREKEILEKEKTERRSKK